MINQKKFYEHCSGIFTMGEWLADYMVNYCNIPREKVHAVGAGINIPYIEEQKACRTGNKILFVGKDFRRKGGHLVVEAFKVLHEKDQSVELIIVGPQKAPVPITDGIKFVGNIPINEIIEYYRTSDIFCMPSYFEAYGIVIAEALCYGLPCITRNMYAMKEMIADGLNGYLIDNDNINVLADKMALLLKNRDIHSYVAQKHDEYMQKYSWSRIVNEMKTIMEGY